MLINVEWILLGSLAMFTSGMPLFASYGKCAFLIEDCNKNNKTSPLILISQSRIAAQNEVRTH